MPVQWQERIIMDPDLHHGEPGIRGTRVPVAVILGSLAEGMSIDDILHEYPQLEPEDIRAVLAYAAEIAGNEVLFPLG